MGVIGAAGTVLVATAVGIGLAGAANAASYTWATSSVPLKVMYSGDQLGHGWGTLFAEPTGGANYFNLEDDKSNGNPVYGLSSINASLVTSPRTNTGMTTVVQHSWSYAGSADGFVRIGEDASWRPDILSPSIYFSVSTS